MCEEDERRCKMSIPILNKENVVHTKEDDPVNTETGLSESIDAEDKKIDEEGIDDIRRKIVDFIKSQGYAYAEGEREFDDETNDIFTKGGTLVELAITIGIDNEVIKQIVEETA
jgi:hypothetical protein